jgi:hypothetical protein
MTLRRILVLFAAAVIFSAEAVASGGTGGGGTGGGGGGGTTTVNPLPSTPPAPDVILRESFGPGLDPTFARPQGGNGNLRQVFAGTNLSGFWLEYPGSKSEAWVTPDLGPGWIFAFASLNPYETLPSPIQPDPFNGIAMSVWTDGVLAFPDALLPFRGASTRYSVSAELYPAYLPGSYVGFGLTSSGTLQSNLPASGQIWILLSQVAPLTGTNGRYEVRIGSQVLASGAVILDGFNPVTITVDPVAQTVGVALKGVDLGTWTARVSPSFIALEGQGWADDLVVRSAP